MAPIRPRPSTNLVPVWTGMQEIEVPWEKTPECSQGRAFFGASDTPSSDFGDI